MLADIDSLTPVVTCSFLKIKIAIFFFLCIRVEVNAFKVYVFTDSGTKV